MTETSPEPLTLLDAHDGVVVHSDWAEALSRLPDACVHAVITDPPYFLDGMGRDWDEAMTGRKTTRGQTVSSLRAGMKFDRSQSYAFQEFMSEVSAEAMRILRPGGWLLSMSAPRLYHRAAVAAEDAGFEIRDMWQWLYTRNQVKAMSVARSMARDEDLTDEQAAELASQLATWKTPQVKSCFEPIVLAQKPREGTFYANWRSHGVGLVNIASPVRDPGGEATDTIVTANVITTESLTEALDKAFLVAKPGKGEKGSTTHLSVKPLALMRHLVEVVVPPGGIVVDPFSGSGSTGLAAVEIGRRYFGVENNETYFGESRGRFDRWTTAGDEDHFVVDA